MHPQLEILLQIQDLKTQRRELAETESEREVEQTEFQVDIDEALARLDAKTVELEAELSRDIRQRYQRICAGRARAVVPVIHGTCYGCFVSVPTALSSDATRNDQVHHCDHCGRFIYLID